MIVNDNNTLTNQNLTLLEHQSEIWDSLRRTVFITNKREILCSFSVQLLNRRCNYSRSMCQFLKLPDCLHIKSTYISYHINLAYLCLVKLSPLHKLEDWDLNWKKRLLYVVCIILSCVDKNKCTVPITRQKTKECKELWQNFWHISGMYFRYNHVTWEEKETRNSGMPIGSTPILHIFFHKSCYLCSKHQSTCFIPVQWTCIF
jgi:hypothetical protein